MNTASPEPVSRGWQPRIVAFLCNWCTYRAADLAGVSRLKYAANVRIIRLMCSGRVDPQFILDAFAKGADGVLIGGCHPNDCHYAEGNYKCLRRFRLLKRMLAGLGIEEPFIVGDRTSKVQRPHTRPIDQLHHIAYAGGWKKFEPFWDIVIRAKRVSHALPLLENILAGFGSHAIPRHDAAQRATVPEA